MKQKTELMDGVAVIDEYDELDDEKMRVIGQLKSEIIWRETLSQGGPWVWEIEHRANVADVAKAAEWWLCLAWLMRRPGA